jgi:cell division protein ZipA
MEEYVQLGFFLIPTIIILFMLIKVWNQEGRALDSELNDHMIVGDNLGNFSVEKGDSAWNIEVNHHAEDQLEFKSLSSAVVEEKVEVAVPQPQPKASIDIADNLLIMSVAAKPDQQFAAYDLLQAISATGMQFGDMNIFHYVVSDEKGPLTLFSLASSTKPGNFNLDQMGNFSCLGLTLFMNISAVPDPEKALELMVDTAKQLAEDLDGELRAGYKVPWTDGVLQEYRKAVIPR